MTTKLDQALDAIWHAAPAARASTASEVVSTLGRDEIDLLTAWDCSASLDLPINGKLVEASASNGRQAIVYTDVPWVRELNDQLTTNFHSLASLLCVAQYARDLLDSDLYTYPAERMERLKALSAQVDIEERRLVRLLVSYDRHIRDAA